MKQRTIMPEGWPCLLSECRPGHFITLENEQLCFKSEYSSNDGKRDIYTEAGEFWCAGYDVIVQPVEMIIEDIEP